VLRARANQASPRRELAAVLSASRGAFVGVGLLSGVLNVLMLTGSFYMLEVYDRVLPSRSVPTLIALTGIVLILYVFQGLIDLIRARILARVGASFDETLSGRIYENLVRLPLKTRVGGDGLQPLRDLDQIRSFLSSPGPTALFDLPWIPLYLAICFAFHFWIGMTALIGAAILVALTLLTEIFTREPTKAAVIHGVGRNSLAESSRRNAEVLRAMGMAGRFGTLWSQSNAKYVAAQQQAADVSGGLGAMSKVLRLVLQSGVLGVGAYLVIQQNATAGVIIASSILTSRALAPVDLAIAHWRGFVSARQGWRRLSDLMSALPSEEKPMALPAPTAALSVESASVIVPGGQRLVVQDATFMLKAGNGLGIIGPSASGKSSLARMIVGVWAPARGKIRIDGAALEQWDPEELGRHIGYLPQDVELFAGTVAQNIARFESSADPETVIAAAKAAGIHEMILHLPEGYETDIGEGGTSLSAGQRQRLALARALHGDPFLVVLDEPNSNLDAEGEQALTQAILGVRARGGIAVVIAHRPSALAGVDLVLTMTDGKVQAFGPKDEVLNKVLRRPPAQPPIPLKVAGEGQGVR
jgi:ATP-binding cassette, subfamily C, bacterial PrsD